MTSPEQHVRGQVGARTSEESPGFLEVRDHRGLFPDMVPDPVVVAKIRRVDRRWRVAFDRARGRWVLFHDHENYNRQWLYYHEIAPGKVVSVGDPTITVQTKSGRYLPLDNRVVRQVALGAWIERNAGSPEEYDALIERVLNEEIERREAAASRERQYWLMNHMKGMKAAMEDGVFYGPAARPEEQWNQC